MKRLILTSLITVSAMVLFCSSAMSFSSKQGWKFTPGEKDENSAFHKRFPQPFQDDITPDQTVKKIKLTPKQKHQALVWGLSEQQEQRYVALMQNRTGLYYKNKPLSPVAILGLNARNNQERTHYAKKMAEQEFQYLAKYLSFDQAYTQQATALREKLHLPIILKFNTTPFSPYNYQPVALVPGDNLMLFIGIDTQVRSIVSPLLDALHKSRDIHLNIYFVGKQLSSKAIQAWAKHQNLPIYLVQSGQLTLNIGNQKFKSIGHRKLPVLVLIRAGKSHFIDMSRF